MANWTETEFGYDSANETINFGTRCLAEGDALYETNTLAVIRSNQVEKNPRIKCLNRKNKIFLAIDNTFRVFSNNCSNIEIFTNYDFIIDTFSVSKDDNIAILCLNNGNIHCIHIPSKGKHSWDASITEDFNEEKNILSVFSEIVENEYCTFLICTKNNLYRFIINDIKKINTDFQNADKIPNSSFVKLVSLDFKIPLVDIKYENKNYFTSNVYKKCFAISGDPSVLALNKNGELLQICRFSKLSFNLEKNKDYCYKDLIFLKSSDMSDHRIIALTENENKESDIKLLSYPNFETIFNIKLQNSTYLVDLQTEQDDIMFIEGIASKGSQFINELRIKVIMESVPSVKLNRLIRKKCFDEAKQFAKFFQLSLQPIFKAELEEFIIKSNVITDTEYFCELLNNIEDINFIVETCLKTNSSSSLNGIESLIEYANKRVYENLKNNPDCKDLLYLKSTILESLFKLDLFKMLNFQENSVDIVDKWVDFYYVDVFEEMCNYLSNGKIDKTTLILTRYYQIYLLDTEQVDKILQTIPKHLPVMDILPLIRHLIIYSIENQSNFLPLILNWIYFIILNYDIAKTDSLEYLYTFSKQIQSFFHVDEIENLYLDKFNLEGGCLNKFRILINSLDEMLNLKKNFRIKISINEYMQESKQVVQLLLDKVILNNTKEFINNFLSTYCSNYHLNQDEIICEYIQNLSCYQKCYWEETVTSLAIYINSNSRRMEVILQILDTTDVPWSNTIENFISQVSKEFNPLAEKVKIKRENIPWKILLKKYNFLELSSYRFHEIKLLIRRILLLSKPEFLEDLNLVCARYPNLKEDCIILCFNHYIQTGQLKEALHYIDQTDSNMLRRAFENVLFYLESFLRSNHDNLKKINSNYLDIVGCLLHRIKSKIPEYEFEIYENETYKLKHIYLLKNDFKCEELSTTNLDVKSLLTKLINSILLNVKDNQISWHEAFKKAENVSHILGIPKEKAFLELAELSGNLDGLIYSAENMLGGDSKSEDMIKIAIMLMQSLNGNYNESMNPEIMFNKNYANKQSQILKAFKLINNLTISASVKTDETDLNRIFTLTNWCHICNLFENNSNQTFYSDFINVPSPNTIKILIEIFNLLIKIADSRSTTISTIITEEQINLEKQMLCYIQSLPEKLQQLHREGYDLVSYHLLYVIKSEFRSNCAPEFSLQVTEKINTLIANYCVSRLLSKVFAMPKVDRQFALTLFLTPNFKTEKWIPYALEKYKNNPKQLTTLSNLTCCYMEMMKISYDRYNILKFRCHWWRKVLHKCLPFNDVFQVESDKIITDYLFKIENLPIKFLQEYCKDFELNIQNYLPLYLRYTLLNWKINIEFIKVQGSNEIIAINETGDGPFNKCQEIISLMENKLIAVEQLNNIWNEINYYHYEVFLCILDLLQLLGQKSNPQNRFLLYFLKKYVRIKKPQQKELNDWQSKYSSAFEIDPLSEYRLPFLLAMFTKDIWEIIRPEIDLFTYERWFESSTILQLDRDEICAYAIKGTIYSGIFNKKDCKWVMSSTNDSLLKKLEICASKINNLEVATAALNQAVSKVSGGADQVAIAKMCLKKAKEWVKSNSKSENKEEVFNKVRRKYLNCVSMHILYTHNLGTEKYLSLIDNTEQLIRELYFDSSITANAKGNVMYCPDINSVVDEFGKSLFIDISSIRTKLIMDLLQTPCDNFNMDDTFYNFEEGLNKNGNDYENLKRVIYICESTEKETYKTLLSNICFSKLDETSSEFATSSDLTMEVKALQCLMTINKDSKELEKIIGEPIKSYLEKLQILISLESIGYSLTVSELDNSTHLSLIYKILYSHSSNSSGIIRSLAKLAALYNIWDANLWNKILQAFIDLIMITELKEWLPRLYNICYTPGLEGPFIKGWDCLISNVFFKSLNEQITSNHVTGLLLLQICPVYSKLDSCLMNIFTIYCDKNIYEICAMILPYVQNEGTKLQMLQGLKPHVSTNLYENVRKLSTFGVLNTDYVINILMNKME